MPTANVSVRKPVEPKRYAEGDLVRFERHSELRGRVGRVSREEDEDGMVRVDVVLVTYVHRSQLEEAYVADEVRNRV